MRVVRPSGVHRSQRAYPRSAVLVWWNIEKTGRWWKVRVYEKQDESSMVEPVVVVFPPSLWKLVSGEIERTFGDEAIDSIAVTDSTDERALQDLITRLRWMAARETT